MSSVAAPVLPAALLRIADLDGSQLAALLDLADRVDHGALRRPDLLAGQSVACYFAKPSTRTRVSFETAVHRLGGLPLMLRPDELQLGRGEPIADTARVLSSYCAAIVVRTFAQHEVQQLAFHASIPVINALTDDHHPCQALADLLVLRRRFGSLAGLHLAYVGDANNVAHSLLEAGAMAGMHVHLGCPSTCRPDPAVTTLAANLAERHGGSVSITHDAREAVAGADAVYTDVWVSMGQDDDRAKRLALEPFRVTQDLMAAASPDAVFMHCLPAHRGQEVSSTVIDGPASIVWEQAAARLPTEQALLAALVDQHGPRG